MPRYVYRCTECEELSTINHSSEEVETECPKCAADRGLVKLLTNFTTFKKSNKNQKVGKITRRNILIMVKKSRLFIIDSSYP